MDIPSQSIPMNVLFVKIQTLGLEIIESRFGVEWVVNWILQHPTRTKKCVFETPFFRKDTQKKIGELRPQKTLRTSAKGQQCISRW